jgi:Nif-specific regulatory protein
VEELNQHFSEGSRHKDELARLRKESKEFASLLKVSELLNSTRELGDLLELVMEVIKKVMKVEASSLLLLDPQLGELSYKVALGEKGRQVKEKFRLKLGQGIGGWVVQRGEPLLVEDVKGDPRFYPEVDRVTGFKTRSILCVPLKVKGKILGALEAINPLNRQGFSPFDKELFSLFSNQVAIALENAQLHQQLRGENTNLREILKLKGKIIGQSRPIKDLLETIYKVANSSSTVLLRGESGTGKELVARKIHDSSPRRGRPFVCVTCSILSETLLESELFGHEKGAFTGADSQRKGRFELADKGTVFLDEVGAMSLNTQIKLLRFLQEREFERVGGTQTFQVDVRIIAATNENLEKAIEEGRFREDLYYRLKVIEIFLPPLRELRQDIPLLVDYYLNLYCQETARPIKKISPQCLDLLCRYTWPGNVRQLKNTIERAVVLSKDVILPQHLPAEIYPGQPQLKQSVISTSLKEAERVHIQNILNRAGGNKSKAARMLGISRNRLERKIKSYQLNPS